MVLIENIPYLETSLTQLVEGYHQHVVPRLTTKNKAIAISTAVILSSWILFDRWFRPPKRFRHLPYQGYFDFMKTVIDKRTYDYKSARYYLPMINAPGSKGLFVTLDRLGWVVHVANPVDAKFVLSKNNLFPKASIGSGLEETLSIKFTGENNLAIVNGLQWKTQRLIINPAFHRSLPVKLFGDLSSSTFKVIDASQGVVEVTDLMKRLTLDVIGNAGFGFDFKSIQDKDNEWANTYHVVNEGIHDAIFFLIPVLDTTLLWMFPERQKVHKALDRFLSMLDDMIDKKRETIANGTNKTIEENERDILTLLLEGEANGDGLLSNQELKDTLALFLLAGHDTTANALSFEIYYLAKHPEYQEKAREEVNRIMANTSKDAIPTMGQIKQMKYLDQIIKETLRITPPAVEAIHRITDEDVFLSDAFIPKGTPILVDIYNIQHNNELWSNPEDFIPDRFAEGSETGKDSDGLTWMPFGFGPRQCIAMNFSLTEQRVLLSMLLRRYRWTLPENSIHKDKVKLKGLGVIAPDNLEINFQNLF